MPTERVDRRTDSTLEQVEGLPLHGIDVVEVAQGVAGPFCGRFLAALGANVVKIERPPLGDWSRSESEYCLTGAAGKPRSLGVNHSCRSSMVSHRCSLNPVTFSTGLGTLGTCG